VPGLTFYVLQRHPSSKFTALGSGRSSQGNVQLSSGSLQRRYPSLKEIATAVWAFAKPRERGDALAQ